MRRKLIDAARAQLPPGFDVDTHFSPAYDPWDQRLCVVPSGDLFRAVREGRASVVTDRIATLTEHGVALASGAELPADVVVDRDRALAADARGRDADAWTAGRSTSAGAWSTRACCCRVCRTSR